MALATYVSVTTFTVVGNYVSIFDVGRRVKCDCGGDGLKYGTVESRSYSSPDTSVVLTAASDNLTSNLLTVLVGEVGVGTDQSTPEHPHDGTEGSGGLISHSDLNGLDYASSGHTDFISTTTLTTVSGSLQTNIDGKIGSVVEDTTPELGGDLGCGGYNLDNVGKLCSLSASTKVCNNTGSTILKGTAVLIIGLTGEVCCVSGTDNREKARMPACGIAYTDITDGSEGCAIRTGRINMDTSGMTGNKGDRLYVQNDGSLDTVIPTSGMVQRVGFLVKKAAAEAGRICVCVRGPRSMYSAKNEYPVLRMGDTGYKKIEFRTYTNEEVATIDNDGNLTLSGTVDGVDVATLKSDYDSHNHTESDITDLDKYTQDEVDTKDTSVSGALDDKLDTHKTSSDHDGRYYTENEIDTQWLTNSGTIDHDTINNTHNLTTDINHDQLTNFAANEHFTEASIDHSAITNLDYTSAGHTGFASTASQTTLSGNLQTNIDGKSDTGHDHTESDITDLDHDAQKIKGKTVDAPEAGDDGYYLSYDHGNSKFTLVSGTGGGGGVTNHSELNELDYATSGHTGFASESHLHDDRYFTETEHIDVSAGAGDVGKPIKLDAEGHVDATMIDDGDVDHENLANADSGTFRHLTAAQVTDLTDAGDCDSHKHDNYYFTETEHLDASAGAGDAGKPIKLDSEGHVDASMINDGDVAHDNLGAVDSGTYRHLSAVQVTDLTDSGDCSIHKHDDIYFTETEHLNVSAGAGDSGKPIKLDAAGHIDASMVNDADIDHGNLTGKDDDDHTQYLNATRHDAHDHSTVLGTAIVTDLSDITSDGADIEDAVTKKHTQNADTALGIMIADIDMNNVQQVVNLQAPAAEGEALRQTVNITEADLEQLTDGSDTVLHDHDGISENTAVRHTQNTDTALGSNCVAADHGTAATSQVVGICYGTGSPPTANTTPIGSLFIKYTP